MVKKERELRVGDLVRVRRSLESGGQIEEGWQIYGFINREDGPVARVWRRDGEDKLEKDVPIQILKKLNP